MMTNHPKMGDRIRTARLLKGLSQQELGQILCTSRQFIHTLESNIKSPSNELLQIIFETLNINSNFLNVEFQSELQSEQCHFRKRRTTTLQMASRVTAFGTILENLIQYLESYVELPPPFTFDLEDSEINESYSRQQIENIAERFRQKYQLGTDTPINDVITLLENLGVVVTSFNGVSDKVDALSFSKSRHFVLRNNEKPSACRQRFDLAHELGHLVLHQGIETGSPITEAEADHFASAFLFPRNAFLREFAPAVTTGGSIKWEYLQKLKLRWKVSLKAIVYRAHSLGLIDSRQYRTANIKLSKDGYPEKGDEAVHLEQPSLLNNTFDLLNDSLGITFSEIAKNVGFEPQYLSEILDLNRSDLSTVNNVSALRPIRLS